MANHVIDIFEILLHLYGGKDQRALVVHIACIAHIGGRLAVAAIGLVRLGKHGEVVRPRRVNDRHQDPENRPCVCFRRRRQGFATAISPLGSPRMRQATETLQPTISIGASASRIANTSSCVRWNTSASAATSCGPANRGVGSFTSSSHTCSGYRASAQKVTVCSRDSLAGPGACRLPDKPRKWRC
jgi:hypothetical protein